MPQATSAASTVPGFICPVLGIWMVLGCQGTPLHGTCSFIPMRPPHPLSQLYPRISVFWSHLSQLPRALLPTLHPGLSNTCTVLWYTPNHPDMKRRWAWGKPLSKMGSFSGIFLLNSVLVLGSYWPAEQRHIHFRWGSTHPLLHTQVAGGLTAFLRAETLGLWIPLLLLCPTHMSSLAYLAQQQQASHEHHEEFEQ